MTIRMEISIHAPREGGDGGDTVPGGKGRLFQSTPPARGATPCCAWLSAPSAYFNPRPPRGGRHDTTVDLTNYVEISIHAPREGGDGITARQTRTHGRFQSTPPARGATYYRAQHPGLSKISIHAPREGGDSKDAQFYPRIFDK